MKTITCPDIPALKARMLENIAKLIAGKSKPNKHHRGAAEKKMKEIVR